MKLHIPTPAYDQSREITRNSLLEQADRMNRKLLQDVEIAGDERLILSSPNGTRWKITVSNTGTISATAI